VNLKDGLGRIKADHGNAHCGRLPFCRFSRPASWHIDAIGGRPPHLAKSLNVRRKQPLIARQGIHHCAPLHPSEPVQVCAQTRPEQPGFAGRHLSPGCASLLR